jgi:hypothetical protein
MRATVQRGSPDNFSRLEEVGRPAASSNPDWSFDIWLPTLDMFRTFATDVLEHVDVNCFQTDPCEPLVNIHAGHPVWIRLEPSWLARNPWTEWLLNPGSRKPPRTRRSGRFKLPLSATVFRLMPAAFDIIRG